MKLVIFGAGASFDSIHAFYDEDSDENHLWRPPLANDIFSDRKTFLDIIKNFEGAQSIKSEVLLQSDIEEYFQGLWDFAYEKNDNLIFSKLVNTQYFFQELFAHISHEYSKIGNNNYDVISNFAYMYTIINSSIKTGFLGTVFYRKNILSFMITRYKEFFDIFVTSDSYDEKTVTL